MVKREDKREKEKKGSNIELQLLNNETIFDVMYITQPKQQCNCIAEL